MKTLRLLSLPIVATIFSISFSACGDDDSDLPSAPVDPQGKHITRIVVMQDDSKKYEGIYSYDSQGRIIRYVMKEYNSYTSPTTYSISYGDNSITVYRTQHNSNDSQHIYSLLNGRITNRMNKSGSSVKSYSYDNQGHLTSKDYYSYTWKGGDLTEVRSFSTIGSGWDKTTKYDYNSNTVPANFLSIPFGPLLDIESVFAMQGYFGKMPIHYASSSISETNENGTITTSTYTYTYKFEDSYPILLEIKTPSDNDSYVITESKISIEWG